MGGGGGALSQGHHCSSSSTPKPTHIHKNSKLSAQMISAIIAYSVGFIAVLIFILRFF